MKSSPSGTFLLSLDCEGKWGVADMLGGHYDRLLRNESLTAAYRRILEILDRHEIAATFAFVGAFSMSIDEFEAHRDWLDEGLESHPSWLSDFARDASLGRYDGWLHPEVFDMARNAGVHEIASHGFFHVPVVDKRMSRSELAADLDRVLRLANEKGTRLRSFIYPRNQIGHVEELGPRGFHGYRGGTHGPVSSWGRLGHLAGEFNLWSKAQPPLAPEGKLVEIPSGDFLNWRFGLRKRVPAGVTRRRWRSLIDDAVRNERVVHLWAHPHNFLDGEGMYDLLDGILSAVSERVSRGEMRNETLEAYSARLSQPAAA